MLLLTCNDIKHLPSSHVWFSTYWTLPEAAGLAEKLWVSPFPPLFTKDQSFCSFEPISFRWDGGRSRAPGSVCVPVAVVTHWEPAEKGGWAGCMLPLRVLWLLTCNVKWFSRKTQLVPPQLFSSCFQNRLLFQKSYPLHKWQWIRFYFHCLSGENKITRSQRFPCPDPDEDTICEDSQNVDRLRF